MRYVVIIQRFAGCVNGKTRAQIRIVYLHNFCPFALVVFANTEFLRNLGLLQIH